MIRNILLTTDFSDLARSAYPAAAALAEKFGAGLRLVHVLEPLPPHYYLSLEGGSVGLPMDDFAVEVKKRLETESRDKAFGPLPVAAELVVDAVPVQGILDVIRNQHIDLVCTSSHGYTGWKRAFLGSFAEKLVRVSPVPVWILRSEGAAAPVPSDAWKILLPTDLSEHSTVVFPLARFFAEKFGARLTLLHVIEPDVTYPVFWGDAGSMPVAVKKPEEVRADVLAKLEHFRSRNLAGLPVEIEIREGVPYLEIARLAEEARFPMVLISTHGWTGWKHLLLGSVTERVVRSAPCGVLTVRPSQEARAPQPARPGA